MFEQLRVNLALLSEVRQLNVNLIGVGAGYSYVVSGPTHQCYEDISSESSKLSDILPSDQHISAALIDNCLNSSGPKYIRLDAQLLPELRENINPRVMADGFETLRTGNDGILISTGYMTHTALKVGQTLAPEVDLTVVDLFNMTGFDGFALNNLIKNQPFVVSLEEGFEGRGGMDALLSKYLMDGNHHIPFYGMGVTPGYNFELGTRQELHERVGIGHEAIVKRLKTSKSGTGLTHCTNILS